MVARRWDGARREARRSRPCSDSSPVPQRAGRATVPRHVGHGRGWPPGGSVPARGARGPRCAHRLSSPRRGHPLRGSLAGRRHRRRRPSSAGPRLLPRLRLRRSYSVGRLLLRFRLRRRGPRLSTTRAEWPGVGENADSPAPRPLSVSLGSGAGHRGVAGKRARIPARRGASAPDREACVLPHPA